MFINPHYAIQQGWITGIKNPEVQIQPNAVDFTLDKLFEINSTNEFIISTNPENPSKELKQMRGGAELAPVVDRRSGVQFYHLRGLSSYDILSDIYVTVPEGVAAILVTRSTFVRNGLFVVSGLYDSGFKGHVGCVVHNLSGSAKVEQGTRVGQIIFVKSENASLYAGGWNHEKGTHYMESENAV